MITPAGAGRARHAAAFTDARACRAQHTLTPKSGELVSRSDSMGSERAGMSLGGLKGRFRIFLGLPRAIRLIDRTVEQMKRDAFETQFDFVILILSQICHSSVADGLDCTENYAQQRSGSDVRARHFQELNSGSASPSDIGIGCRLLLAEKLNATAAIIDKNTIRQECLWPGLLCSDKADHCQ